MNNSDFAVFILTYKRPNMQYTTRTIRNQGYTGKIYYIVGLDDPTLSEYVKKYGNDVLTFDKKEIKKEIDVGDNFDIYCTITYARCAVFKIAKSIGVKCFVQLDDDYRNFIYRNCNNNEKYRKIKNLDKVFQTAISFLYDADLLTFAFMQSGDFMAGKYGKKGRLELNPKAMNTFFCRTDHPLNFLGSMNEDVNFYLVEGRRGEKIYSTPKIMFWQKPTQKNSGGITETYRNSGTYHKSFYSVMYAPSCVTIKKIGYGEGRPHHRISWEHAVPKILREVK